MVSDEQARRLLSEAVDVVRVFQAARNRSHATGVTGTKIGVLKQLRCGDARLTDIAERLTISLPVTSRAVTALEAEGYVVRRTDPDDARASLLSISPLGLDLVTARESAFVARFRDQLVDWSDDDAAQAEAALSRLKDPLAASFERPHVEPAK